MVFENIHNEVKNKKCQFFQNLFVSNAEEEEPYFFAQSVLLLGAKLKLKTHATNGLRLRPLTEHVTQSLGSQCWPLAQNSNIGVKREAESMEINASSASIPTTVDSL